MKSKKYAQIAFIIVGILTVCEFIFVRGMFTWLLAVAAIVAIGVVNILVNIKQKDWLQAALFLLSTVALSMGYFVVLLVK